MASMLVTDEVSHLDRLSGLNDEAPINMRLISVTADVFQDEMLPSKAEAPSKLPYISVTDEVSHFDRSSWLNDEAMKNIPLMSVADDVFQDEIS